MSASERYKAAENLYDRNKDWFRSDPPDATKARLLVEAITDLMMFPEVSEHGGSERVEFNHAQLSKTRAWILETLATLPATTTNCSPGAVYFDTSDWTY